MIQLGSLETVRPEPDSREQIADLYTQPHAEQGQEPSEVKKWKFDQMLFIDAIAPGQTRWLLQFEESIESLTLWRSGICTRYLKWTSVSAPLGPQRHLHYWSPAANIGKSKLLEKSVTRQQLCHTMASSTLRLWLSQLEQSRGHLSERWMSYSWKAK